MNNFMSIHLKIRWNKQISRKKSTPKWTQEVTEN